jgi:transcriptional regulator with XRE-family HTH domain
MIYEKVKSLADKKGMNISELEKRAGLSNGTIGKWRDSKPLAENLAKVAKVLNVSVNTLLKE